MRQYLAGDSSAFEALYHRHSGKVYGYLKRRLDTRESVDEVFQSVFFKFHRSRSNYDFEYKVEQWLFVIAKTVLRDHFRKMGRQVQIANEEISPEHPSETDPDPGPRLKENEGMEGLQALAPDHRQAIQMRVIDELSYQEIATRLNRSQESVRQMVSRGLKKLRLLRGGS